MLPPHSKSLMPSPQHRDTNGRCAVTQHVIGLFSGRQYNIYAKLVYYVVVSVGDIYAVALSLRTALSVAQIYT